MAKINLLNHKRLWSYLGQAKLASYLTPLFSFGELLFAILIPRQMASIIDQGVLQANSQIIKEQGLYLLAMSIGSLICGILASLSSSYAGSQLSTNLRSSLFKKILSFSFHNYDQFQTASLVTRLTNDLTSIQFAFIMTLRMLTKMPILLILALFMTFNINKKIALTYLVLLPIVSLCLFILETKAYPLFRRLFRAMDDLNANVKENVTNIKVVKAFVREQAEYNKFMQTVENLYKINYQAETLVNYWNPVIMGIIFSAVLLVITLGGRSLVFGSMQVGELTSIMIYTMQIVWSFFSFAFIFMINIHSEAARTRVLEVLNTQVDLVSADNPIKTIPNADIEFVDVCFSYEKESTNPVLSNISFKLKAGQSLGIIGATGSGKSSLVQLLPRLYDVSSGQIKLAGQDIRKYDLTVLRDAISLVLQKNVLFKGTISANLRLGNKQASQEELKEACQIAGASEFIEEFKQKYAYELLKSASNLSGGQKQRLCIARALLKNPQILILDDATSALDTRTERKIQQGLKNLRPGMSKIIIAQRLSSVLDCDFILVMKDGKMDAFDTVDNLLKSNQIFQDLYNLQQVNEEGTDAK